MICLIVCCSIGRHLSSIYEVLDFPYKKWTKNSIQNIKNPNLTRTGIFGNFSDQLGLTDWFISVRPSECCQLSVSFYNFLDQLGATEWFVSVPPSECCQLSVSFCNLSDQLGLTDWFASVLPSEHCQLSGNFPDQLGLTNQINSVGPK